MVTHMALPRFQMKDYYIKLLFVMLGIIISRVGIITPELPVNYIVLFAIILLIILLILKYGPVSTLRASQDHEVFLSIVHILLVVVVVATWSFYISWLCSSYELVGMHPIFKGLVILTPLLLVSIVGSFLLHIIKRWIQNID